MLPAAASGALNGALGPLRVSPDNPRYFVNPADRIIYLAGAHTWNNLVDMGSAHPPPQFDFDAYLDFLQEHNLNLVRLWTWEVPNPRDWFDTPRRTVAAPLPWVRSGPGLAADGLPRFDLTRLDDTYFSRLRERVASAQQRRMYVAVMLFEGWSVQRSPGRETHPFHPDNNINGTGALTDVRDVHTLKHPQLLQFQDQYIERVVETLAGFDNILFEIVNEAGGYSTEWQYRMLDHVRARLDARSNNAPVGMTFQYENGRNETLWESTADWISPGLGPGNYRTSPLVSTGDKVVIADSDHLAGSSLQDALWAYRSLLRGLNLLYMDRYMGPDSVGSNEVREASSIRAGLGIARLLADGLDLRSAVPDPALASSGFAMRAPDWFLALATDDGPLEVDLRPYSGPMLVEWLDPVTARVHGAGELNGGEIWSLQPQGRNGALLLLRPTGSAAPSLAMLEPRAREIRNASLRYTSVRNRLRLAVQIQLDAVSKTYRRLGLSMLAALAAGLLLGVVGSWLYARRPGSGSIRSSQISRQ